MYEDVKTFKIFSNVFDDESFELIKKYNLSETWKISQPVGGASQASNFLYTNLTPIPFFSKYCVQIINEITQTKHELYRCYRNGMVISSRAVAHYDTHNPADTTFLLYAHESWNPDWGGETTFDDEKENFHYVQPIPNSAAYFSAKHWKHQGRSFTINSPIVRVSYVWKLKRV
jgi:hypothetical protein